MTIFTDGLRQGSGNTIDELHSSLGEYLGATSGESFESLPMVSGYRMNELGEAERGDQSLATAIERVQAGADAGDVVYGSRPAVADVPIEQARARVKEAGLDKILHLGDAPTIKQPALDIMLQRAQARREREATIARGPGGVIAGALGVGTSLLVSALDPINIAAAFIPVIGEARYAKLLASAGEGVMARAAVRAEVGAASGAVGMAAIEPIEYLARNQEGQDYTMAEALRSVMYGALLGGVLHTGGGAVADVLRGRAGKPLYPFAEGEPFARPGGPQPESPMRQNASGGTEVPARAETPLHEAAAGEVHPVVAALDDLPPRAKEDVLRASIAALHDGEPVRAGEMLQAAARADRRIAESLDMSHRAPLAGPVVNVVERDGFRDSWRAENEFGFVSASADPTIRLVEIEASSLRPGTPTGQGFGTQLYKAIIDKALAEGYVVESSRAVSKEARRLYEGLERKGYRVETVNPDGMKGAKAPVYRITSGPSPLENVHAAAVRAAARGDRRILESLNGGSRASEAKPQSLLEFIAAQGGVKDSDPQVADLMQSFGGKNRGVRGVGMVITKTGKSLDAMREAAVEAGYLHDAGASRGMVTESTIEDLLGAVDREARGQKVYPAGYEGFKSKAEIAAEGERDQHLREQYRRDVDQALETALDDREITSVRQQLKVRATTIMEREGIRDPEVAIERALSEYGMARGPVDIDQSWRKLSQRRPDYDEPAAVEASQAAAKLPPPESLSPEPSKRVAAAEKAAAEAEADYKANEAYIPDDLKAKVEQDIKALEAEGADRAEVIQRGAACLAAAVGAVA